MIFASKWIRVALGIAFATLLAAPAQAQEKAVSLPKLPEFQLPDADGDTRSLEELKGRVTMVNFFFPTCDTCNKELPYLKRIYEKYRDFGFSLISINIRPSQNDMLTQWASRGGYRHPILRAPDDQWRKDLGVKATPTNCLLGADNRMIKRYEGYSERNLQRIEEAVRRLLGLEQR